jgi:hypothetical protein
MGDSEEETFRKLSAGAEIPDVGDGEAQARQVMGDKGFDATVAQIAQGIALDTHQKQATIQWTLSRAALNRSLAITLKWSAAFAIALATYITIR